MPQLGETVTEGTITRWLKKLGDPVAEDEVLFEVSTDKVDSEVPSPAAGVLSEILVAEGDTVDVGTRLAVIAAEGSAPAPAASGSSLFPLVPPSINTHGQAAYFYAGPWPGQAGVVGIAQYSAAGLLETIYPQAYATGLGHSIGSVATGTYQPPGSYAISG